MLPEMAATIEGKVFNKTSASNSWVTALLDSVCANFDLTVCMFYNGTEFHDKKFENYRCIAIPYHGNLTRYHSSISKKLDYVNSLIKPDLVHVHGTEYPYVYNILQTFDPKMVIISAQGLISVIAKYYLSGISKKDIISNITIRNIIFRDSALGQKKEFIRRGSYEIKALRLAKYVIGRTDWDKIHMLTINPQLNYYHLDELLREDFFKSRKWDYRLCDRHTIFLSQCNYPIKGLHKFIEALSLVKRRYADVKVRIAGRDFLKHDTIVNWMKYSGYAKYINHLISKYGLDDCIIFTGVLDAQGMASEYLKANVFVCPSNIENSPNSMCEAQFLGVPCVLSNVGGVYYMTNQGRTANLYRFEEVEMLASYICNIFEKPYNESNRIEEGLELASKRHSKKDIANGLLSIYEDVLQRKEK